MDSVNKFSLCQYNDLLGKPNEGLRSQLRVFNISVIDVVLTLVLGLVLSRIFRLTKFNGILLAFVLSVVFHKIFCVETTVSKFFNLL
jgi:hypothetical protein